jgi:tetratricopeptide (TPR) repeat protein
MSTTRTSITGTGIDWLLAVALASAALAAHAAPYLPDSDSRVLEHLPVRPSDPVARELRSLRADLAANPRNRATAIRLAERYFALANAEGDPRYVGYAEAALKPWWDLDTPPLDALVMRAILKQYSHDFAGAMKDLEAATRGDPGNARAWSWRAAIDMVQANYAQAREDCLALSRIEADLYAVGCMAFLDGTTGKAAAAYRALSEAYAHSGDDSPEMRVWVLTRLAEMSLRMGDNKRAEEHFRAAYFEPINDQFLLAAYADFLLDQGRPDEVVPLLVDWPRSDILLLRLALAEKALKAPKAREHIEALRSRFEAAALRGDKLHQQEEARFNLYLVGNEEKALALAQENWKLQREPRDARILLESALAVKDPAAAQGALDWLERSGHEDPGLRATAQRLRALKP